MDERVREFREYREQKMRNMFSYENYVVIWTSNTSGGSYVIRQVRGDCTALRVTGNELEHWEDLIKVEDFMLGLQPNVMERILSRRN